LGLLAFSLPVAADLRELPSPANKRLGPTARCGAAADAGGTATSGGPALTLDVAQGNRTMSVPAVIQLQEYATDEAHDVSELLRKALLVATKLKLTDFREWLSHELNGYDDKPSVPQYRTIRGELRVQNPYHGLVPFLIEDGELAEMVCKVHVTESVAALRNLIAQSGPGRTVAFTFPPEAEAVLMRMQDGFAPLRPLRVVGTNQLTSVINTVRNRVLEWALALEEEGIVGDGLSFSREEKTIAASNPNIRIDNFQGILGDVHQSRVTQENRLD
jgi:hypothetical protein